jgi:hypothetical protein
LFHLAVVQRHFLNLFLQLGSVIVFVDVALGS